MKLESYRIRVYICFLSIYILIFKICSERNNCLNSKCPEGLLPNPNCLHFQLKCVYILVLLQAKFQKVLSFLTVIRANISQNTQLTVCCVQKSTVDLILSVWRVRCVWLQSEHKINTRAECLLFFLWSFAPSPQKFQLSAGWLDRAPGGRGILGSSWRSRPPHARRGWSSWRTPPRSPGLACGGPRTVRCSSDRPEKKKTWRQNVSQGAWTEASLDF